MNEDRGARYHRLKRRASLIALGWSATLLTALTFTGASALFRTQAVALADAVPSPLSAAVSIAIYVTCLILVHEIGALPIAFYGGFWLERRYALSSERLGGWLRDQLKSLAVAVPLAAFAANILYFWIRRAPVAWWVPAGATFAVLIIAITRVAPVLLLPLFYRLKPLDRQTLRERLVALADRAGARVLGVYEWGLGDKTKKANAALAGIGSTRRILVSDTMLAEYSDEEIELVLAHEVGHHVHGDIWKGLALEGALLVCSFWLGARLLAAAAVPLGFGGPPDVAGLPLLLLVIGAVSTLSLPLTRGLSRANERRADRFALTLTNNPDAFVSAMRRMSAQNLAEEHPSALIRLLFYSHPPVRERIAAAQLFKRTSVSATGSAPRR